MLHNTTAAIVVAATLLLTPATVGAEPARATVGADPAPAAVSDATVHDADTSEDPGQSATLTTRLSTGSTFKYDG